MPNSKTLVVQSILVSGRLTHRTGLLAVVETHLALPRATLHVLKWYSDGEETLGNIGQLVERVAAVVKHDELSFFS